MKKPLKARIRDREKLYGLFVMIPSPAVVEMAGYAGFDYVIIDLEHGAATTESLEHLLRAADAVGIPAIVRVGNREPVEILRVLDAGACGILAPHVLTAEDAARLVSAAHYPPIGNRGMATTTRAGRHGFVTVADHLKRAREETVVLVQIEDAAALPRVSSIAATPHVDGVFIGPADLAASLGRPGEIDHPDVAGAIDGIVRDTIAAKGPAVCCFARSEADVPKLLDKDVTTICLSTTSIFQRRLKDLAEDLRKL
ncbi:MAG TPA: aldolase/citrate lyase family protein [Alphaproteobacteria bacterium]